MAFDPDEFLAAYDAQPAAEGVPPVLARPNAGNVPNYTHDPVPPDSAQAVRAAISQAMAQPGFDAQHPDEQRNAIIEAVHSVTRKAADVGNAFVNGAASAVPFGRISGAALASAPVIGNGQSFRQNYDGLQAGDAQSRADHPLVSALGSAAGGLATIGASGGLSAPAAAAPVLGNVAARAAAPVAANTAIGGVQGAADAAAEGGDAREMFNRGLRGATAGAALSTAAPIVAKGVGDLFTGAATRSNARMLKEVGDGAPRVARFKVNEKGDELVDLIRRTPALEKTYKNPAQFAGAAEKQLSANGSRLDEIYGAADQGGKIDPAQAHAAILKLQQQIGGDLSKGEIADALEPTISKLDKRAQTMRPIGSRELRAEVTRLQDIANKKGPGAEKTEVQTAAGMAANALKDVLEAHVEKNLPGQLEAVKSLNADQTLLSRIKGASSYKAMNRPNENTSRLAEIGKGIVSHGAHAAGVGGAVHGAMTGSAPEIAAGVATAVAPHVLPAVGRGLDEGLAKVARASGVTAEPVVGLARRLTATTNPAEAATAIADHIFGSSPAASAGPKKPYKFGLQDEAAPAPRTFGLPDEAP